VKPVTYGCEHCETTVTLYVPTDNVVHKCTSIEHLGKMLELTPEEG